MRLTAEEVSKVESILEEFKETKEAEIMKRCIQHGRISTYDHVCSVALLSFYLNRRFHLGASDSEVVRGAFLHDFYLYDWHKTAMSDVFMDFIIRRLP